MIVILMVERRSTIPGEVSVVLNWIIKVSFGSCKSSSMIRMATKNASEFPSNVRDVAIGA